MRWFWVMIVIALLAFSSMPHQENRPSSSTMVKAPENSLSTVLVEHASTTAQLDETRVKDQLQRTPVFPAVELSDLDSISFSELQAGQRVSIRDSGTGESIQLLVSRVIKYREKSSIAAKLEAPGNGLFALDLMNDSWRGLAQIPEENLGIRVTGKSGGPIHVERLVLSDLICARPRGLDNPLVAQPGMPIEYGLPRPTNRASRIQSRPPGIGLASVPILRSRPSSSRVIYLDFDGETATDAWWNGGTTINAAPAGMTDVQITETWRRVVEDFDMFDVNVTTSLSDYENATVGRRTHCVITPTDTAMPGAGGVAFVDSFVSGARYCWAFIVDDPKDCAEVISHEVGHTLGLNHDGRTSPAEEYYAGHGIGATGWAPIMGIGYYQQLVQWSKGEYLNANRTNEDDLAIIAGKTPLITDDHANSTGGATAISGSLVTGIIESSSDIDVFRVSLTTGTYVITLQPDQYSNLDAVLEVLESSGTMMATSNPLDLLSASNQITVVSSNVYYLRVKPTGKGDVLGTGYSSYGSIGGYTLQGFGNQQQAPSPPVGVTVRKLSATQLEVIWQPVVAATHYEIIRNDTYRMTVTTDIFTDAGLEPSTLYSYAVKAINSYGTSTVSTSAGMVTPAIDEFIMDGANDFIRYTLSNPGMVINAAIRGNRLYVSSWSPGSDYSGFGNDHHIFVSDQLLSSATTPAPWAKRGFIAIPANKPYLAGEYSSSYAGWFNLTGSSTIYKSPSASGQLEGSFDLVQQFGSIPSTIYIAVVAYQSDDASGFDTSLGRINSQAPAAITVNDSVEPQEFMAIPTASIRDTDADGIFDVLSPSHAFRVTTPSSPGSTGPLLSWPAVPGIQYQVYRSPDLLTGSWSLVYSVTAGQTNWTGQYSDPDTGSLRAHYQLRWQ